MALPEPHFGWEDIPLAYPADTNPLPMAWGELEQPFAVNVGNPHLVFFVPDAREMPLERPRAANRKRSRLPRADQRQCRDDRRRSAETADVRAWGRRDPGLRDWRLRQRGRGDRHKTRHIAGQGRHDRRQPHHRLGARASRSACAAARPMCSRANSTWTRWHERRDDQPRLPVELRRKRDAWPGSRPTARNGWSSTAAPSPTRPSANRARRSAALTGNGPARKSSSPAARSNSTTLPLLRCPEVERAIGNREQAQRLRGK